MTHERTAVPNPPVGAGGEQPQVQKTNDSITDVTEEIKGSQAETREHDADRPSSGGPAPDPDYAAHMEELRRKMERVTDPNYLPTITMNELYENVYKSRPPVIDGLLRTGTYLMAGAPKVGKSFLVGQIAYHVSTGKPLWGYNVRQGTVLYLALEDDYQRLQERMSRMFGVEGTDDFHFTVWAKPLSDGLPEQLDGFLQEHPDTRLVIIDTLQKVRESTGENYSYASDYDVIGKLKQFSDTKCVCLIGWPPFGRIFGCARILWSGPGGWLRSWSGSAQMKQIGSWMKGNKNISDPVRWNVGRPDGRPTKHIIFVQQCSQC